MESDWEKRGGENGEGEGGHKRDKAREEVKIQDMGEGDRKLGTASSCSYSLAVKHTRRLPPSAGST